MVCESDKDRTPSGRQKGADNGIKQPQSKLSCHHLMMCLRCPHIEYHYIERNAYGDDEPCPRGIVVFGYGIPEHGCMTDVATHSESPQ